MKWHCRMLTGLLVLYLAFISIAFVSGDVTPVGHESGYGRWALSSSDYEQCGVDVTYALVRRYGVNGGLGLSGTAKRAPLSVFERGMSLSELEDLLDSYGLWHVRLNDVDAGRKCLDKGAAIVLGLKENQHFVAYFVEKDGRFLRYNPPYSVAWVAEGRFIGEWQGVALAVLPSENNHVAELASLARKQSFPPAILTLVAGLFVTLVGVLLWHRRVSRTCVDRLSSR